MEVMVKIIVCISFFYLIIRLLDIDDCSDQDNVFESGKLLEEHLAASANVECVVSTEVLELQDGFDYFTINDDCIYDLTLNNYPTISNQTILYLDGFKHLRGHIKLQYFGKLKIVTKGDLYLDDVTFLNTFEVEITSGFEKDNSILPLISCNHIWLSSTVAPHFHIHNTASLSLIGDIVACNAFELHDIVSVNGTKLTQLLSDDVAINLVSFVNWNGAMSSCLESESKRINIFASKKINFLRDSKLVSMNISISGSGETNVSIAGLVASTRALSIHSNELNILNGAKINSSGPLAVFKSTNFIAEDNSFFYFRNAELESGDAVIKGKMSWDGVLKFIGYSAKSGTERTVDVTKAALYGSKIVFDNMSNVKATKESILGASECIWKSKLLQLHDDLKLEWLAGCHLTSDIIQVKSCNFTRDKYSVIKARSLRLTIDGDDCKDLSLSLHGIVDISGDTVIRSYKTSQSLISISSTLKSNSLTIDVKSGLLKCDGCRIAISGKVINSVKLEKLVVTSEIGLNDESKKLSALYESNRFNCYEPVFVSERCVAKVVQSHGENLFTSQIPHYIKIASVFVEGALNLDVNELVINNAAFIVDDKLNLKSKVKKLTLEATKGFKKVTLGPVSVEVATRSSSGTGYILDNKPYSYSRNQDALQHFNKYDLARRFDLISQSELDECVRAQSAKDVYCPIYVEGSEIIRNTDGLQSIFHAKSYGGASIQGLSIGTDIPASNFSLISSNMPDVQTVDVNNQWSNEVARHKTLLQSSGAITSLENLKQAISSEIQAVTSGDSKVAVLKRHRLSGEIALNLDNLGAYEVYSSANMQEFLKKALPDSSGVELIWNILDYPKSSREFLHDDAVILKLFKCVSLEFPIVNLANQDLTQELLSDLILATVGKLKGISSARLLEHLVDNTCAISDKLKTHGAKPGVALTHKQKELFEAPGVWPFWLNDCPGDHTNCISLELALNERSIDKMLPSGAKLSADEHIILDGTRLELGMSGNIVAGKSIKAKLVGDTRIDGRMLAKEIKSHVDGNLKNVGIISGGKVLCIANNVINLGLIEATKGLAFQTLEDFIAAGFLGSEGSLSLDVAHKLTLLSLKEIAFLESASIKEVRQNVAHITSIIAKGALEINAGGDILNIGAEVIGESAFISTSDKIITVPLELYNEVVRAGKYCYESYKGSKFIKPVIKASDNKEENNSANSNLPQKALGENAPALIEKEIARIKSKSGTVLIRGKKEVQIVSSDISAAGDISLLSEEGGISVKSIKPWQETTIITRGSDLISEWEDRVYLYDEEVSVSSIKSGGTLRSYSLKDQEWIGASIKVVSTKLAAGTSEHKARIAILPTQINKIIEVETKSITFGIKLQDGGVSFIEETDSKKSTTLIKQFPTIIELEGEFLGYASGQFIVIDPAIIDRSEDERGNIHMKIKAEEINLEAAPDVEATYSFMNEHGIGVGFSAKGGEFAIKGCIFGKSSKQNVNNVKYKTPKPFRGWIELDAKTVKDAGVVYFAQSLHINAEIEIHGIVVDEENESNIKALFENGIKFGIKSNLGAVLDSTTNIAKGDYNRPEGQINAAMQGYKVYVEALKLLSSNFGLSGGGWLFMHADETSKNREASQPVPTVINVLDQKSKSSELHLLGTQVSAYRAYIETKYLKGDAAKYKASDHVSSDSVDIEIPLTTVPPNILTALQKATEKSEFYLNANIYVSDRLTLKVAGKADLKGVSISAEKLEASFNELVLESLQNVIESEHFAGSLGGGVGKEGSLDSLNIGNQIQDRSRHVVDSLTVLLGREYANIVIVEALRMNGALIANAERDNDGKFTDHGNLTLKVGELFVQHIYDYDKGETLGAALSYTGGNKYGQAYIDAMPTFGSFKKDGFTRSTIGKDNVQVGRCNIGEDESRSECEDLSKIDRSKEGLNRDVGKVQEFTTHHSIEPITLSFTTIDTEKLKERILRDKNGKIDFAGITKDFIDTAVQLLHIYSGPEKVEQTEGHEEEGAEEDFSRQTTQHNKEELNAKDQDSLNEKLKTKEVEIFLNKIFADLKAKYGDEKAAHLISVGKARLIERLEGLKNIKESQYATDGNNLVIRLHRVGIVPAGAAESGIDVFFEIVNSPAIKKNLNVATKAGESILKVGKYAVRVNHYAAATMLLYDIGSYLIEFEGVYSVREATEFAKSIISSAEEYTRQAIEKTKDKVTAGIKGTPKNDAKQKKVGTGTTNPEPDDDDKFKWEVKDSKDADKVKRHEKFGKFYRDPKQKIGNKNIWWTKDHGKHAGSKYKIFVENNNELEHVADLDESGLQILKHKGEIGKIIKFKDLIGIK